MQAAVLRSPGPASALHLENIAIPEPGEDDVLVEVRACGVSYHDIVERNGTYRRDVRFPIILGCEIGGVVVDMGKSVNDFAIGDHVCCKAFTSCGRCRLCRNGRETSCAQRRPIHGGYAQYAALPTEAIVKVPPEVPFEVSCSLGPTVGVALNAVRDVARITIGEDVLVTGASGGVGGSVIQIARQAGAHVIAVTRSEDKAESLREIGAHDVIVSDSVNDFSQQVKQLTRGRGVDCVVDCVGSRVFDSGFSSLAVHGRYIFVGQLFGENISINPASIFFKRAQLLGVGSVSRSQLEDVVRLAAAGRIVPRIAQVFPLSEVATAHSVVEQSHLVGRVVVAPFETPSESRGRDI